MMFSVEKIDKKRNEVNAFFFLLEICRVTRIELDQKLYGLWNLRAVQTETKSNNVFVLLLASNRPQLTA